MLRRSVTREPKHQTKLLHDGVVGTLGSVGATSGVHAFVPINAWDSANIAILLSAIQQALERSRIALDHEAEIRGLRDRYASLSRREREVMALVVPGLLNKQVAFELGISEITVKAHRGKVMRKMKAGSFADLVNMAARLRPTPALKG